MHRQWYVSRTNPEYIHYLSRKSAVSPILAQILVNRGLKSSEEVSAFLNPDIGHMSDPFELPHMKRAVERIITASEKGEKVLVHGDYDTDGLTATAIMVKALQMQGVDCDFLIPNRMVHGYGFTPLAVREAKKKGSTLIITVDCGITSFDAVSEGKKEGIDVIITDHHEPKKAPSGKDLPSESLGMQSSYKDFLLPEAYAIIDPKIADRSPLTDLSGAGIAFKLAQALSIRKGTEDTISNLLGLAALGTIADVVPLTGENRTIVRQGLRLMGNGSNIGLLALQKVSGIEGKGLKPGRLLFTAIPRINAPGRIADANDVINMFLTDSDEEAFNLATWLDAMNTERQKIEGIVYQEALQLLEQKTMQPVIVLAAEGWHKGVIGIVASKIADTFHHPVVILSIEQGKARGSARSIPAFNIYEALAACGNCLTRFGGHKQAAGLELAAHDIPLFEESINRFAEEFLSAQDYAASLEIDALVSLSDLSFHLLKEFELMEPFGSGNPEPLLGSKNLEVLNPKIVKDIHLKMKLRQKENAISAIGFDMASYFITLESPVRVDAAYTPFVNEWDGAKYLNLKLQALRPSMES